MKVFVTGGTGVIGTRALPALVAAGHEVTAIARSSDKAELVRSFGATPVTVDLFDEDAVRSGVAGHEAVVHLATNIPSMTRAARRKGLVHQRAAQARGVEPPRRRSDHRRCESLRAGVDLLPLPRPG